MRTTSHRTLKCSTQLNFAVQVPLYVLYLDLGTAQPKLLGAGTVQLSVASDASGSGARHKVALSNAAGLHIGTADITVALRRHVGPVPVPATQGVHRTGNAQNPTPDASQLHAEGNSLRNPHSAAEAANQAQQHLHTPAQSASQAAKTAENVSAADNSQLIAKLPTHDLHFHYHISGAAASASPAALGLLQPPAPWSQPHALCDHQAAPTAACVDQQEPPHTSPLQRSDCSLHEAGSAQEQTAQASGEDVRRLRGQLDTHAATHPQHERQAPASGAAAAKPQQSASARLVKAGTLHAARSAKPDLSKVQAATGNALQEAARMQAAMRALQASANAHDSAAPAKKDKVTRAQRRRLQTSSVKTAARRKATNAEVPYSMTAFMAFAWEMMGFVSMRAAMNTAACQPPNLAAPAAAPLQQPTSGTAVLSHVIPTGASAQPTQGQRNVATQDAAQHLSGSKVDNEADDTRLAPVDGQASGTIAAHHGESARHRRHSSKAGKRSQSHSQRSTSRNGVAPRQHTHARGDTNKVKQAAGRMPAHILAAATNGGKRRPVQHADPGQLTGETEPEQTGKFAEGGDVQPAARTEQPLIMLDTKHESESVIDVAAACDASDRHLLDADSTPLPEAVAGKDTGDAASKRETDLSLPNAISSQTGIMAVRHTAEAPMSSTAVGRRGSTAAAEAKAPFVVPRQAARKPAIVTEAPAEEVPDGTRPHGTVAWADEVLAAAAKELRARCAFRSAQRLFLLMRDKQGWSATLRHHVMAFSLLCVANTVNCPCSCTCRRHVAESIAPAIASEVTMIDMRRSQAPSGAGSRASSISIDAFTVKTISVNGQASSRHTRTSSSRHQRSAATSSHNSSRSASASADGSALEDDAASEQASSYYSDAQFSTSALASVATTMSVVAQHHAVASSQQPGRVSSPSVKQHTAQQQTYAQAVRGGEAASYPQVSTDTLFIDSGLQCEQASTKYGSDLDMSVSGSLASTNGQDWTSAAAGQQKYPESSASELQAGGFDSSARGSSVRSSGSGSSCDTLLHAHYSLLMCSCPCTLDTSTAPLECSVSCHAQSLQQVGSFVTSSLCAGTTMA